MMLDVADGVVARLLKATSAFGAEFDSFADLVAFGLAPAALVLHFVWQRYDSAASYWIAAACGLYALFAAMRLARFNSVAPVQAGWFKGVPTAACGSLLATGVMLMVRYDSRLITVNPTPYLTVVLVVLGLAMISNLRFPKFGLASTRLLNVVYGINTAALYICASLRVFPEYLFGAGVVLIFGGLAAGVVKRPRS